MYLPTLNVIIIIKIFHPECDVVRSALPRDGRDGHPVQPRVTCTATKGRDAAERLSESV